MESISAYVYSAEIADPKRRVFYTSLYLVALNLGVMQGSIFGVILTSFLTDGEMHSWGWRIPFAVGAVYGLFVVLIRRGLEEPPTYENAREPATGGGQRLLEELLTLGLGCSWHGLPDTNRSVYVSRMVRQVNSAPGQASKPARRARVPAP